MCRIQMSLYLKCIFLSTSLSACVSELSHMVHEEEKAVALHREWIIHVSLGHWKLHSHNRGYYVWFLLGCWAGLITTSSLHDFTDAFISVNVIPAWQPTQRSSQQSELVVYHGVGQLTKRKDAYVTAVISG